MVEFIMATAPYLNNNFLLFALAIAGTKYLTKHT